jgi:hypothetical protein
MIVQRHGWLISSCVLAVFFALTAGANGIPALRHDWFWPRQWSGSSDVFLAASSAWQTQGIGAPNPFVNNYLLVAFLVPLEALFGAYGALLLFFFGTALAIILAARKMAVVIGASQSLAMIAGVFALFNPWTYCELIAGHGAMLVAYAATMALVAEAIGPTPRPAVCALAAAFTLPQLQFFVPALAVVVALLFARRMWLPIATWVVSGAATFAGVALSGRTLLRTPVTAAWEQTQSLLPLKALVLSGYFARYADGFDHYGKYAVACIALLALVGAAVNIRSRIVLAVTFCTAFALLVAMGANGPLGSVLTLAVDHAPVLGLYRELYDLIGYVAIGYIFLAVLASRQTMALAIAFGAAAAVLALLWTWHTPVRFWADRRSLPAIPLVAAPNTRIALLPAFQPLSYNGMFSGLDPDAYPRGDSISALNEAVPVWPSDAALATYARSGDDRALAALSVSEIAQRPWYATTSREFAEQIALPMPPPPPSQGLSIKRIAAVPELSLAPWPRIVSIIDTLGSGSIFFGDVAKTTCGSVECEHPWRRPNAVRAPRHAVHASDGWVDARLAFAAVPELAQPFGGALTTSKTELLALPGGGRMLMVYVIGRLVAEDDRVLTTSTKRLEWINLPPDVRRVRCDGLCEVVLQGDVPPGIGTATEAPAAEAVSFRFLVPWLVAVIVPAGSAQTLRFNVRYDDNWECWGCPNDTQHVPLDSTFNGWLFPARTEPITLRLVERAALLQTVGQVAGLIWIVAIAVLAASRAKDRVRDTQRAV